MNIKKIIFRFLLLALLFHFTVSISPIARINDTLFTWIWIAGGIALINLFTRNILKFLTLKTTFITMFLATVILTTAAMFFLDLFIPGFDVKAGVIGPINIDIIVVNAFKVSDVTAKLFVSFVFAIFVAIMDSLNRSKMAEEE